MTKLLILDNPLMVLPKLAEKIGLNEAIALQQLHYWLLASTKEREGKKWIYNTYENWQADNFPFWSVSTIGRIFRKLSETGLVITKRFGKENYDQTKWYTINYQHELLDDTIVTPSVNSERNDHHITETTTETNVEEYFNNRPEHLVNKGETKGKRLTKAELTKASLGIGNYSQFANYPDVVDNLDVFLKHFPKIKVDSKAKWIKQARVWGNMGLTTKDIEGMCKYAKENFKGVAQPASITSAYNMMQTEVEPKREQPVKRY